MRKYLAGALFGLSMLAGGISVQAAEVTGESSDIKSLSVGSGTLSAGDSQKVTIGLDSSIQADEALLEVYNETIDYRSVYYATANEAGQLEFDFEIPEEGTYSITGLKLVDDGNTYEYSLSDLGLTQEFCASGDTDDDTYDDDENVYKAGSGLVVVIDAGHGGYDGGAESTFNGVTYSEKYMNLKIAQACRDELQKYYGVTVYMTRDDDTFVKLGDRTAYAKSVGADVFVSIHNNSSESGAANGATVFYPNSNYNASIGSTGEGLAQSILNNLTQFGLKNNGVQIRNSESGDTYADGSLCDYYSVIRGSKKHGFPGLIVEHAFLSNQSDAEKYLNSDAKLTALGVADAKGIAAYYGLSVGTGQLERQENGDWYMMHNGQIDTNYNSLAYYQGYWYVVSNGVLNRNFTGLYKYQGNWYYVKNGTVDFHYTGLAKNSAGWFYVDDGKINWNYNGLAKGNAGWFYVRSGKVDFSKNGLVYNAGNWFYIQNGYLNWNTTTLVKYNGRWYGVHNGYVDWNYSGIIRLGGSYYYVSNGILNWNYTGLAKNKTGWFYVKNGKVDFSKTGLVYNAGNWFYVQNGFLNWKTCTLAQNGGVWYGVHNGYVDWSYSGIIRLGGSYYYVSNGILNWKYTGLAKNDTGWFYVKNGKVDFSKTGLVYNAGNWFWITKGFLNWNSNGVVPYANDWFCIRNGRIDWSYTGLAVGTTGTWYIKNGIVDFSYNGPAVLNGDEYIVYGGHASVKGTSIMGTSSTSVEQMVKYYNAHAAYPAFYAGTDAPTIEAFCQIYMEECAAEGVKAEVAFCQAMNETGFLKFGGQVSITQYNFAGMGATDDGAAGASFPNVRTGVRAQVQHLKGYASTDALNNACVDPRFAYLSKSRGCAPIVEWLGINENPAKKGWATSVNYGYNLRNLYMNKLAQY
ncbi:MAG: N-acetylmuramoyl-L-alanine amidase [Lachnospiraceae bacterium]|nr:N-acetylmuramoyl-L-alanine amidase [Lachnospiraceae bacterium]